jgi:uncharacterized iron-regulated membrane protein
VIAAELAVRCVRIDRTVARRVSTLNRFSHVASGGNLRLLTQPDKLSWIDEMVYNIPRMGVWQRWMRQPQKVWLRRAMFQVHLWTGIALGLYIVMLSVSGSVLVYRNELDRYFATPRPRFDANATQLTPEQMRARVAELYPGWTISSLSDRVSRRNPTIEAQLERGGEQQDRLFNPYTGDDLGPSYTQGEQFVLWLARLHDELLFDRDGRWWNGFLSGVFTLLVTTGLIVWWPGSARWRRSLGVKFRSGWKRFNWDLHSALGFWLFGFMLMWGISGWYLGIPEPATDLVDWISDPETLDERPGDLFLAWLSRIHFGRFRGNPYQRYLQATWAVVGIVPAVMFVTGMVMWWNRVIRRKARKEMAETV